MHTTHKPQCLCWRTHIKCKIMHRVVGKTSVFSQIPIPSLISFSLYLPPLEYWCVSLQHIKQIYDKVTAVPRRDSAYPDWTAAPSTWTQSCRRKGQVILLAEALFSVFRFREENRYFLIPFLRPLSALAVSELFSELFYCSSQKVFERDQERGSIKHKTSVLLINTPSKQRSQKI